MSVSGRYTPKGFKGPFKGKGGAQRQLKKLDQEIVSVRLEMGELVERYKNTFRPPWAAYLSKHNWEAGMRVRWRTRGVNGRQHHFDILNRDSPHAQVFLAAMPKNAWETLLAFEEDRLALNFTASLLEHEHRRVRAYLEAMLRMEALRKTPA